MATTAKATTVVDAVAAAAAASAADAGSNIRVLAWRTVGGGVCVLMLLMPVLARLFGGVSFCGLRARSDVRVAGVHG